jgi:uncharacterized protein YdaU (DUF1376 family)
MYHYQFNIGDYRKDTAHLSLLEHGIYRMLIDSYYTNEGPLPADDAKLMRTHCVRTADEQQAYKNIITDFFSMDENHYRHAGCDKVLSKIYEKSTKARESAEKRWANKDGGFRPIEYIDNANVMRTHSERNADGMLPITHNPIPITTGTNVPVVGAKAPTHCPHLEIIEMYNRILPELQHVIPDRWSGARADALKSRWRESAKHQRLEFWERFFSELRNWPFYMGENDRAWKADLGWIVKRANFDKLIEKFTTKKRDAA